jgi:prepilin-type N-terminal cleavage/methylation domain-containing protein
MKTKAFTLVELMIVVAIIGLLAAISIPNYVRPRATSQANKCINNLRQIEAAKEQFLLEKTNENGKVVTPDDLTNYLGSGKFPTCPAGGIYKIGAANEFPTCSITNHALYKDPNSFPQGSDLDLLLVQLPYGNIGYYIPKQALIDNPVNAVLRLSPEMTTNELRSIMQKEDGLQNAFGTNIASEFKFAKVKLSNRMMATLETDLSDSNSITITPETESTQALSFKDDTIWKWRLTARKPGTYWLYIQLSLIVEIDNHDTYRTIRDFSDTVVFKATNSEYVLLFLEEHWGAISSCFSAIIIPLIVYFWKQRKKAKIRIAKKPRKKKR